MNMYQYSANELVRRIESLVPDHPEILSLDSPWALFRIDGFKCDDLAPSLYQAGWALAQVKAKYAAAGQEPTR